MDEITSLFSQLPAGDGVPEWVHLVPAGTFRGADGRGPYTLHDAGAVIAGSLTAGDKLPICENHAIDRAIKSGAPSPARGWVIALESRADGLWGRVEWTPQGRELVSGHAYRGISPVIASERTSGRVVRVLRATLTNTPNLTLTTLHDRDVDMDLTKLRQALGLKDDADEAAILAAAAAATTARTQHAADLKKLATAAGATEDVGVDGLVTHLQARGAAGDPKELAATVVTLQTSLTTLQQERAREKAEAVVDGAIAAGKPVRALRDHYVTRHMADPTAVEKELDAMVSLRAGGLRGRELPPGDPAAGLDATDHQVIALMGVDAAKFAEARKAEKTETL